MGEVHHHIALRQRLRLVPRIDGGRELQVVSRIDRGAYLRPHAPLGAEHTDLDHRAPSSAVRPGNGTQARAPANASASSNGPTTASTLGRARISVATARTWSSVTASIAA